MRSVDAVAGRTGLTRDAVAILFVLAGILILVFPRFLETVLAVLLIVVGVVWLASNWRERKRAPPS